VVAWQRVGLCVIRSSGGVSGCRVVEQSGQAVHRVLNLWQRMVGKPRRRARTFVCSIVPVSEAWSTLRCCTTVTRWPVWGM